MNPSTVLKIIKVIHTLIWAIMASLIFYIFYSGITKNSGPLLWFSVIVIIAESAVLIVHKGKCPLTLVAMKYTSLRNDNFDIYLPTWLAKYNKVIFSTIFMAGLLLVLYNLFAGH